MFDTNALTLYRKDAETPWNTDEIKKNLMPADKYVRGNFKPTGMIRNMAVFINDEMIKIDGSIPKYFNNNNIENFDFRSFPIAIMLLSDELGVDLRNARVRRLDIAANFELENEVSDYFLRLYYLKYFQRDTSKRTTLRFYSNSGRRNLVFYDKIKEFATKNKKLIQEDTSFIDTFHNLVRYEFMMQSNPSKILKIPDLRVKDLFEAENCKKALKLWFDMYNKIHKKSLLEYPDLKGLKGFEVFMKRYLIYEFGRDKIEFLLKKGIDKGLLSSSDKSKKLKQFDNALNSDFGFKFDKNTIEFTHKVRIQYVEGLKQIFRMNRYQKIVK
ncbi:phage/plasmid replication protein [Chryseobacterium sp.]|uniref:phage/plasmid replication domain-containing protein n=1 Tax=Chryseobacterium sp. TaxID=1871047 RepID=UPI0031DD4FA7